MSDRQDENEEFKIDIGEEADEEQGGESDDAPRKPTLLLSYLRLCRIPNVFTAFADIAMGYLFVHRGIDSWEALVTLLAASGCLYTSGMVLNDVFDLAKDAVERPHRPIPSGAITLPQARSLGFGLLVAGVLLAMVAGWIGGAGAAIPYRSGIVGVALAVAVLLYNGVVKQTMLAPWMMGACRFLNVLLGMSLASTAGSMATLGYEPMQLAAGGGLGVYIVGVTWFARTEAEDSNRFLLGFGLSIMLAGLALLAFVPELAPAGTRFLLPGTIWPFVIVFLMIAPMRRCLFAVARPDPQRVQMAVKQCILSLIVLDAALVKLTNPFGWALAVVALLVPTLLLGRWVYST